MRDIAILAIVILGMIGTVRYPYIGILLWTWITLEVPHQQAFGFSRVLPINLLVAVVAILSLFLSPKENKKPPADAILAFTLLFLAWITFNGFFAVDPGWSWPYWDRTWRIILLGVLISITANNRTRIHAMVLVVTLSLLYFGVKGGAFTLMTGGNYHVMGPDASAIGDNNALALAILMAIPLGNYVRMHSSNPWARHVVLGSMILSMIAVLGSYSRGAFLALAGLVVIAWLRAKRKWLYPIVAAAVIVPALHFMPQTYFDRLGTIQNAQSDDSFVGRLTAWHVAFSYARDHFPLGAGFAGPQLPSVFGYYAPGQAGHAAHSIYFEVLGDSGFAGLALYLGLLGLCFWNTLMIRKKTKRIAEMAWVFDLAGMIQLTLFVFCVGGAALSFAYYDLLFILAGLLSAVRLFVERRLDPRAKFGVKSAFSTPLASPASG
jgi:putative inorganic carbon (HCO3(-)) transporter